MFNIADIVLENTTVHFDKKYSYLLPQALIPTAMPGSRVVVPFGNGNKKTQGLIFNVRQSDNADKLKSVISVVDKSPVLSNEMLDLCEWLREQVFCTYYDAIHAVLPPGLNFKIVENYRAVSGFNDFKDELLSAVYSHVLNNGVLKKEKIVKEFLLQDDLPLEQLCSMGALVKEGNTVRRVNDATLKMVHLNADHSYTGKITPQQSELISLLEQMGDCSVKELLYFTGVSQSVITTLKKHGVVETYDKEVFRLVNDFKEVDCRPDIVLTEEQKQAFDNISKGLFNEKASCNLLYGVTGSGKTQVFLSLVDKAFDKGLGSIVMVPEISLTPQTLSLFGKRYGNKIAVFHSAMSLGQRLDEWKRVKNGEALVAIGTRSAVFAPFEKLGLIIMDEEQEHTYKSEQSPRFHARNVAKFRANYHNAALVLASATPSMESYTMALNGKYQLQTLTARYGNAVLPQVETVDMRAEVVAGNAGTISRRLYNELNDALTDKKQAILLINRRGYNTYISCPTCGYVATCPNCSISMTYHSANKRLMCHYCGHSVAASKICPECSGEHMRFYGIGTQKVEDELHSLFPKANILRLDADSTMARNSFAENLSRFSKGEYDILVGTQMVAKGLDFPNVTLVGVIGVDGAKYSEDYRSFERTFSLLTQVVGRAGRGETAGKAIIQTDMPESEIIRLAIKQDYEAFYKTEILTRKMMIYPPFCDIALVAASSSLQGVANETIRAIFDNIKKLLENEFTDVKVMILGPSAASVPKVNNKYRYRMIIKCKNNARLRALLKKSMEIKLKKDTYVSVDINPETVV